MPLIPNYLVFLTLILVVLPSIVAIFLRIALYLKLVNQAEKVRRLIKHQSNEKQSNEKQVKIVEELENRFKNARSNLWQVNTAALIDQAYSQEKVWGISCDQIDYFCRILPNLLLAFGLMGTFIGITINLTELSKTISGTTASDVSSLVRELQQPLQGMGIAFITSLTGLFFSAFLTVVNFCFNSSLAKYQLISSLEDYLDNIYQPTIPGQTPFDRAVTNLVTEFNQFLTRFGDTVRDAVESSLGSKIQQIVDVNEKANNLAIQVYSEFKTSSGTIARSADDLKHAVGAFQNAIAAMMLSAERFEKVSDTFEQSQFPQTLSKATADFAIAQEKFSDLASSFAYTVQSIEMTVSTLHNSSQQLVYLGETIDALNQTSVQVLGVHQVNQQSLGEIISQLQQVEQSFQSTIRRIDKLQKRIVYGSEQFSSVQVELKKLVDTLNNYTQQVNLGIAALGKVLIESINNQTNSSYAQSQLMGEKLDRCVKHLQEIKNEMDKFYAKDIKSSDVILDELMQKLKDI